MTRAGDDAERSDEEERRYVTAPRTEIAWQRLSPRMLLIHPVHELLRELPLLIGGLVLGSTTGNQSWTVAVLALTAVVGVARWVTTSYRIDADPESGQVQLRAGLLHRKVLSVPRNRIRSVQTDARLLHRLFGLAVLRVSTGQETRGEHGSGAFELDAVRVEQVPRLRAILLAESPRPIDAPTALFRSRAHDADTPPDLNWRGRCPKLFVVPVEGDHRTMLDSPNRAELCRLFAEAVERSDASTVPAGECRASTTETRDVGTVLSDGNV